MHDRHRPGVPASTLRRVRVGALAATMVAVVVLTLGAACGLLGGPEATKESIAQEAATLAPGEVPVLALAPVGDIWEILRTEHVDRETLDAATLAQGAVDALLTAAGAAGASVAAPAGSRLEMAHGAPERPGHVPAEFDALWDAWAALFLVYNTAESPLDPLALSQAAMTGLVAALGDPHSSYVAPQRQEVGALSFIGHYHGIGSHVEVLDGAFIMTPIPGSPAEEAGLEAGDRLVTVDGVVVEGWAMLEVVRVVRGPKDSVVVLGVERAGAAGLLEIAVTRGDIELQSVTWQQTPEGFAYIRLSAFYANTDEALETALQEAEAANARGLLLDLRNNTGGLLDTTVNIGSLFLDEGLIVYEVDGGGDRKEWEAEAGGASLELPMVALVNQYSASASEVLAGALQDRGRATVVGVQTFGKGTVNRLADLPDGGGLYYSYGRWYTPDGRQIEGTGVTPDVVAQAGDATRDRQYERALEVMEEIAAAR